MINKSASSCCASLCLFNSCLHLCVKLRHAHVKSMNAVHKHAQAGGPLRAKTYTAACLLIAKKSEGCQTRGPQSVGARGTPG